MSRDPGEPPFVLDAARVVRYAVLDPRALGSGTVVNGVPLDATNLVGVAVVEALLDGTIFLLHCNERWETLAAGEYADAAGAEDAAKRAYGAALAEWIPYRALTEEEQREIQTTSSFLRELASEEFGS